MRCQAMVQSKDAKQGLGAGAICKQRLGALCGCKVWVYPSKDKMAWFGAVLSAMVGCKVKVLGLVRWWVLNKPSKARVWCGC